MSSLFGSLSIAMRSLMAQQGGLQVTSENIANVNTPGYTRQRAVLREDPPVQYGSLLFGTGVELSKVESVRDRILELRIYQETGQQGELQSFLNPAQQVEGMFSVSGGSGLQAALNNFFGSLSQLSANPSDVPTRQSVLSAAQNLASTFQQTATRLVQIQRGLDQGIPRTVDQINQLSTQIARLNGQIMGLQAVDPDAGLLTDQRNQLIGQLSGLIDVAVVDAGDGSVTVTTSSGAALAAGSNSFALATQPNPSTGLQHIIAQGNDITAAIQGGQLGGVLQARDQFIPSVQTSLDDLAANLNSAVNTQHQTGFDLTGAAGGNFFVPFVQPSPGSNAGAAATFTVAITNPTAVAASSDGSAGDNANAKALAAIQSQTIVANQNPIDFFAGLVSQIGNQVANANSELDAEDLTLTQLRNQLSSVSGVSLDEEAINLIRYQRAYEAAARVINVVDSLTQTALNIGAGN